MSDQQIIPERITKPIQLLAAWLAGLVLVNGSFLGAAGAIPQPEWVRATLVIASVVNVPLFLLCLFLLQTKFRPEMQEDSFYARYLELNTGKIIQSNPGDLAIQQLRADIAEANARYVEMIGALDVGLKSLAAQIAEAASSSGSASGSLLRLSETASRAEKSAKAIQSAIERASDKQMSLQVNDLTPNYPALRRALLDHGLVIDHTFGSTSTEPETPKILTIGFGAGVPMSKLRLVIAIARDFGFEKIHYTDEPFNANKVFIGSYIYRAPRAPQPVPLTDSILAVVNDEKSSLSDVIDAIDRARA